MFEQEERFTAKDIELSSKTLEDIKLADDALEEAEVDDNSFDNVNDEGEYEIGEEIRREDAGLKPLNRKPKDKEEVFDEKTGLNEKGFDKDGKDKDGNPEFNDDGFNKAGFNKDGKDKDDKPEFDDKGFNKDGLNKDGFNEKGFGLKGFDKDGKTADGRSEKDFTDGFDKDGLNALGYDKDGKDKDGNTAPSEEISDKEDTSSSEDALVFSDIVDGKKEISIKIDDGKDLSLKDVLEVFKNQKDWNAKNTQNAQVNARAKDDVEATQQEYEKQNLEFKETLELITKDAKFLEETDEFFGGEKKNPIRKLFETVNANQESVANRTQAEEESVKKFETDSQKRADDELAIILAEDESYNSITKVQELYKLADEHKVGLMTAFRLSKTPILEEKLSTIEKTHKEATDVLDKKITDLTEELKKRNEKIQKLEKNPKPKEPDGELDGVIYSDEEVSDDNSLKTFDDVENKYKDKWNLKN